MPEMHKIAHLASKNFAKKGQNTTKQDFIERETIRMEVGLFLTR